MLIQMFGYTHIFPCKHLGQFDADFHAAQKTPCIQHITSPLLIKAVALGFLTVGIWVS